MTEFIISPPLWFIIAVYGSIAIVNYKSYGVFLVGYLAWQVWEYASHRWIFHGLFSKHHRVHHINPLSRISLPLFISSGGTVALALILGAGGLSGFLAGYVWYEIMHRVEPPWHLWHHQDEATYFGVSTPLLDYLLRTE